MVGLVNIYRYMEDNIQSGEDYARVIINTIIEGELDLPREERMDSRMLQYWCEEIQIFANKTWEEYIIGDRDTYLFSESELKKLYENAGLKYASDILNSLVDREMIEVSVAEGGDLQYSLTEKGKKYTLGDN